MGHLVLGLTLVSGIGLATGAIFYQATKPRPGLKRHSQSYSYSDGWAGPGGESTGGHDGHAGDGGH